jgi:putative membrane protein
MKNPITRLLIRWFVCSLGLWIAAGLFDGKITFQNELRDIIVAGLILAIINAIIRPILVILSLPAILISLGLFMIVINGFTVYLMSLIYDPLEVVGFWTAMLTGIIIGLVNYLVSAILEARE